MTELARDYPDVWRRLDQLTHDVRATGTTWPDWCWAPMAAAYAIASDGGDLPKGRAGDVARIAALAAWRVTQGIYRLDETLLDELWTSDLEGALPVATLLHLPEWCVYVETPGRSALAPIAGFWAHLEADTNDGRIELRLMLDMLEGPPVGVPLHLGRGRGSLEAALSAALDEATAVAATHGAPLEAQQLEQHRADAMRGIEMLRPLVSVVLYLCTTAEQLVAADGRAPSRPPPKPGRKGEPPRYYPPSSAAVYPTGLRLGAALRAARERAARGVLGCAGASPVGHVRRAHWHTYLLGPRGGPQQRDVRWLPPIFVGLSREEVEAVVHQVRRPS